MMKNLWKQVTPSDFAWEREALEFLRAELTDHEPYRAWSNFEFIAEDGSINEVDLLVVSRYNVFLVEIKSRPGEVGGDAHTWVWRDGAREYFDDNPLLLHTNMEAGHSGASGRYRRYEETAMEYAFLLSLAGLAEEKVPPGK